MLRGLLTDLRQLCRLLGADRIEILLTINHPEDTSFLLEYKDLPIFIHINTIPKGFGANHNAAFERCHGAYFGIVNPDIRLASLNIDLLIAEFDQPHVGAVAPRIIGSDGVLQDSARRFPTPFRLALRVLTGRRKNDYPADGSASAVDWVAGMFILFDSRVWRSIGGFDERFFMYLEDTDICRRLKEAGWSVIYQSATTLVHDAQRASHRDYTHLRWHMRSMLRFLLPFQ